MSEGMQSESDRAKSESDWPVGPSAQSESQSESDSDSVRVRVRASRHPRAEKESQSESDSVGLSPSRSEPPSGQPESESESVRAEIGRDGGGVELLAFSWVFRFSLRESYMESLRKSIENPI